MAFSILSTILALVAPDHHISCAKQVWHRGILELKYRGMGYRESGAFLLGLQSAGVRRIVRFAYYNDLDPHCLDDGYVNFDGRAYGKLWDICRQMGLSVVADVHTHPGIARQSWIDQQNPMIAQVGHAAILVPNYARQPELTDKLGVYEYLGDYQWKEYYGLSATRYFYLGL
jgi:hypothetical protein